jgi:hypothetical protein
MYFTPQIVSGIAVYRHHIRHLPINLFRKILDFYAGTFIIPVFVTVVQLKGIFRYLLRVPQGWKVTSKGIEHSETWKVIVCRYNAYIIIAVLMFLTTIISWRIYYYDITGILNFFPGLFISVNLLLSLIVYGKSGRIIENKTTSATIDEITNAEFKMKKKHSGLNNNTEIINARSMPECQTC